MTLVLALETTSEVCSVALGDGRNILVDTRVAARTHNQIVLEMVDQVVAASPYSRSEIELVAFSSGPGSFTGVRLGASVAQGIALGLGIKVLQVPTSAAMARAVHQVFGELKSFSVKRKSRKGWWYVASYEVLDGRCDCLAKDQLIGEDWEPTIEPVILDSEIRLDAQHVLALAVGNADSAVAPREGLPTYVEGDSPYVAKPK